MAGWIRMNQWTPGNSWTFRIFFFLKFFNYCPWFRNLANHLIGTSSHYLQVVWDFFHQQYDWLVGEDTHLQASRCPPPMPSADPGAWCLALRPWTPRVGTWAQMTDGRRLGCHGPATVNYLPVKKHGWLENPHVQEGIHLQTGRKISIAMLVYQMVSSN